MCLECGAVREDISPDSDVCTECKSGPTSTHPNATKELIEFVEYMGFERPVILAAIMKLQLDNQSIINTETVVGAIGELLAPIEDDNTGAHQSTTSPPSTVPHLPMHNPPPPKLATPSAPPLHTQDSPASDSDRTKCKICYESEINTVLVPCGHRVVCLGCSTPIQSCPICRVPISQVIKTYDT